MAGSHGNLTKAGKVRYNSTQKVQRSTKNVKSLHPRLRNRRNYFRRIEQEIPVGQPGKRHR